MIPVGKDWAVGTDGMNIVPFRLSQARKGRKGGHWIPQGYFSTLQNALEYLVDQAVMDTGLKDLKTVVAKQGELYGLIASLDIPQGLLRKPPSEAAEYKPLRSKALVHS
jgi:hypothetical protein